MRAKAEPTRSPPWHYLVSNVATAWASADPEIMARYAELVEDPSLREARLQQVLDEHRRTGARLAAIYGAPVPAARAEVQRRLDRRNSALAPLHDRQVELLARWRRSPGGEAPAVLEQILLTVNAIASGLGQTG